MNSSKSVTLPTIKTRFLILSDTHSQEFTIDTEADVAIHCGDLTEGSTLEEFHSAIKLLTDLKAPLKLVIPGNHDFTLDIPLFKKRVELQLKYLDAALIKRAYGDFGEARQLFNSDAATSAGIVFLEEGTHSFDLRNGASLTVFASPSTPSQGGGWAFQYPLRSGHTFEISNTVDLVMTHGPPKGILDHTLSGDSAGSTLVFEALARARPRLHCFGHIHERWGAKLVTWAPADQMSAASSYSADIDEARSVLVADLSTLRGGSGLEHDGQHSQAGKADNDSGKRSETCHATSHCSGDTHSIEAGSRTLFVNASIKGVDEDYPLHLPWLVDIELPKASLGGSSELS
ncbi:serine/threonine phosphatase [Histoplasma capsulatum]|uniref:Serine/threonine phosphatase n=1 Tax=Ajellomyces capsulatus TaxID=5037 RepID=A0A8A1M4H1_AJECA|nr:serine/threonine phosphatase [Histoplasma capsulatum]